MILDLMGVLVTLTGVLENIVIVDRAYLLPSIHLALYGWPCTVSGMIDGLYLCNISISIGLLAVNVTVPVQIFPSDLTGRATTI